MLIQVVNRVTSGLMKVESSEEFRPSATVLIFRSSVAVLISTDENHKQLLWFEILKYKNVSLTTFRPLTFTMTVSIILLHASCQLPVSKYFIQLSICLSSLTHNLTSFANFYHLAFLVTFKYDVLKMSSVDIKYFNLIRHCDCQQPFSFSNTFRCTPHFVNEL